MKRYAIQLDDETLQGIRSCSKAEKISQETLINKALCAYLQGFEVLVIGPNVKITTHNFHREALLQMAGAGDWYASKDLENRSFEGNGIWARIVRIEVPR